MARAPEIPRAALESIARQIGKRLSPPGMSALAKGTPLSIAESFPVYMLGLDALLKNTNKLDDVASNTGVWQHQIRYGSQAQEIARSTEPGAPSGSQEWQVQEVVASPSAARIDEAIAWIDKNAPDDAMANLLLVPAFYMTAFWLKEAQGDEVVIADMPPRLGQLRPLRLYSAKQFLKELAELKPIAGVPADRPIPERL